MKKISDRKGKQPHASKKGNFMIDYRLEFAKRYLEDADLLFNESRFNSAVSRAYYASYQAMWAALGEPETGVWRHLAIIKHFVRGYWADSGYSRQGPGLFEDKRLSLRRLYLYRVKSDYDAVDINRHAAEQFLDLIRDLISIIEGGA